MHHEMTLAAIEAGKAVLCEKPMAMNAREAQAMMKAAQKAGVLAHINHELRFLTNRQKMRAMIADGELGEINHAKVQFRSDYRIKMNWNWWSQREAGGGTLGAIGSHAVDTLRWMLGAEVEEVSALLSTHFTERFDEARGEMRTVTTDDEANLLLRFVERESKQSLVKTTTGATSLSVVEPGRAEHYLEVFGTRGSLRIEERGDLWHAEAGAGEWKLIDDVTGELAPGIKRDSGWGRGWTAFARELIAALREGRTSVEHAASFEDGYHTQLVLDAARRSHESGQRVSLLRE
jgi:predicted dehydrogenase